MSTTFARSRYAINVRMFLVSRTSQLCIKSILIPTKDKVSVDEPESDYRSVNTLHNQYKMENILHVPLEISFQALLQTSHLISKFPNQSPRLQSLKRNKMNFSYGQVSLSLSSVETLWRRTTKRQRETTKEKKPRFAF